MAKEQNPPPSRAANAERLEGQGRSRKPPVASKPPPPPPPPPKKR